MIWIQKCPQAETRTRVNDAIDAQWQQIQARALKPHDSTCEDPVFCTKMNCFTWEPDTIVPE